jgi:hypothetical protein
MHKYRLYIYEAEDRLIAPVMGILRMMTWRRASKPKPLPAVYSFGKRVTPRVTVSNCWVMMPTGVPFHD